MSTKESLNKFIMDPSLEDLDIELSKPNIFKILGIRDYEIRHSNFLAWLLDPNANHGLRDIFLKRFLKEVFSNEHAVGIESFHVDDLNNRYIEVYREFLHTDILIKAEDFVVVIENKVRSGEGLDQLKKYKENIKEHYKSNKRIKHIVFVYLTPFGKEPLSQQNIETYIPHSYESIKNNLELVLSKNSETLSEKNRLFIDDYYEIVRRHIMADEDEEMVQVAKAIYKRHKEALDFIFENRPDRLSKLNKIFIKIIDGHDYLEPAKSQNKAVVRFTTNKIEKHLDPTGTGWKNHEAFLFEIPLYNNKTSIKSVISPGEQQIIDKLQNVLSSIEDKYNKTPRSTSWLTMNVYTKKGINLSDENKYDLEDQEKLENDIKEMLNSRIEYVKEVERAIVTAFPK